MQKLFQSLQSGDTFLVECPSPNVKPSGILIDTKVSLISLGTEKMLMDFGKANYIQKALQQPDKVRMVLEKIKVDGVLSTAESVRSKLNDPIALGYCNVGEIVAVGPRVTQFSVGQRVVSNGPHSNVVSVAENLCCAIPDEVSDDDAAFTVLASIGLQGIRLASPTLGETFVVIGAGLIGLLTIQLLVSQGCRVLAIDLDESRLKLAEKFGAKICNIALGQDPVKIGREFSRGRGVDGVLVTASTKSNDPVAQAARMCRKRGRIILVGVAGLQLNRNDFYEKELSFQVSCSYGPGRYDPAYEEECHDYPFGFVRWTEQRNFEAVLDMMAAGKLDVKSLVSHRFDFSDAEKAYQMLDSDRSALGMLLDYPGDRNSRHVDYVKLANYSVKPARLSLGFIGAGNYASRMLIPAFKKTGVNLSSVVTASGSSAVIHGKRAGFTEATTNIKRLLNDTETAGVVIVTQHNSHASLVVDVLKAGKHVFVEKPLALTLDELQNIKNAWQAQNEKEVKYLMVGFNRRFSPLTIKMKELLSSVGQPKSIIMTMNAGYIPADHWAQDPRVGGGRIIGEACHYIDLMRFLVGAPAISIQARCMGRHPSLSVAEDKASITLGFEDGSLGTIHYFANGASSFPKERIEVFVAGRVLQIDNFRKMKGFGWPSFSKHFLWKQDKGQSSCARAFVDSIEKGLPCPIPPDEIFEVARVSIEADLQLRNQ